MSSTATTLANLTLVEASELVRRREVSPTELVDASLQQIADWEPTINAFITILEDQARREARARTDEIAAGGDLGPLHGIPIGLKDNIFTAGVRTTAGSRILADFVPTEDAAVVERLRRAGAIVIGKTNMHEFAWGGTTDNPHYGPTRNPWDPSRFPAGSSGGSGAAVAAREVFGALGTDTGGSIRLPSAVNGCVGIRPTIGRVPNHNVVPLAWSMDTVGPMARTVADVAVMLRAIAGYHSGDPGSAVVDVPDYLTELRAGVEGMRIGVIPDYFYSHLQPQVKSAVVDAIEVLVDRGAEVVELKLDHIDGNIAAQLIIESVEPSTYHHRWLKERPDDYGADVRLLLEIGELYLATDYLQAQRYRTLLQREFMAAFTRVDVLISPTLPFVATPIGATTVEVEDGKEEDMLAAIMQFTGIASLTGLPAMSIPCGFTDSGLPIGMQIIGRPFEEETVLRVGNDYEKATTWHVRRPYPGVDAQASDTR